MTDFMEQLRLVPTGDTDSVWNRWWVQQRAVLSLVDGPHGRLFFDGCSPAVGSLLGCHPVCWRTLFIARLTTETCSLDAVHGCPCISRV